MAGPTIGKRAFFSNINPNGISIIEAAKDRGIAE